MFVVCSDVCSEVYLLCVLMCVSCVFVVCSNVCLLCCRSMRTWARMWLGRPTRDTTPACLPTARQDQGRHTP